MQKYGDPVQSCINSGRSVTPNDFEDDKAAESFCNAVVDYQWNNINENIKSSDVEEYLSFEASEDFRNQYFPAFIIAPYFYIDSEEWLEINRRMLCITKKNNSDKALFAQIVVPQSLLDDIEMQEKIVRVYSGLEIDGILIWIDNFSEYEVPCEKLIRYIQFLSKLKEVKKPIYNLYGSYFSIILTNKMIPNGPLLRGVGHSLEYGEYRSVVPVGGGIPKNKFYYFKVHNRIDYAIMSEILYVKGYSKLDPKEAASKYFENVCNCKICKSIIGSDLNNFQKFESTEYYELKTKGTNQRRSYASASTKEICVLHYQLNKAKEYKELNGSNLPMPEIISDLRECLNEISELPLHLSSKFMHLENWVGALECYWDQKHDKR